MLVPLRFSHWSYSHCVQALPRPCPVKGSHSHWSVSRYPQPVCLCLDPLASTGACDLTGPSFTLGDWSSGTCCLELKVALFSPAARGLETALLSLRCLELHLCSLPPTSSALSPSTADFLRALVSLQSAIWHVFVSHVLKATGRSVRIELGLGTGSWRS